MLWAFDKAGAAAASEFRDKIEKWVKGKDSRGDLGWLAQGPEGKREEARRGVDITQITIPVGLKFKFLP